MLTSRRLARIGAGNAYVDGDEVRKVSEKFNRLDETGDKCNPIRLGEYLEYIKHFCDLVTEEDLSSPTRSVLMAVTKIGVKWYLRPKNK